MSTSGTSEKLLAMLATSASGSLRSASSQSTSRMRSVEQDVARVDVVVGGHRRGRPGYSARMRARPATCPSRTPANSPPSRTRFSSTSTKRAEVLHQRGGAVTCSRATISPSVRRRAGSPPGNCRQRTCDHEVHQHHARLFVGVVHGRDAGLCRERRAGTDSCAPGFGSRPGRPRAAAGSLGPASIRSVEAPGTRVVGLIAVTSAGSATGAMAASAAARRSAIAENTSAISRPWSSTRLELARSTSPPLQRSPRPNAGSAARWACRRSGAGPA